MGRRYIAVSIKHTMHGWKFGKPLTLWGWKRTEDNEKRCFAGYTEYPAKCERYSLGDFQKHGYTIGDIKDDEPVPLSIDLCRKWKNYDTVLLDEEQVIGYYKCASLQIEPPKEG